MCVCIVSFTYYSNALSPFFIGKFEKDEQRIIYDVGDWVGKETLRYAAGGAYVCSGLVWVGDNSAVEIKSFKNVNFQDHMGPHPEIYSVEVILGVCQNLASRMCYHSFFF